LTPERRKKAIASLELDLCIIFGDAFFAELRRHAQHKHRYAEEFLFSINMLDRAIENVLIKENEETREQILTKLPDEYQNFADVFSKSESSILPPHRLIDHKVELLPDATPLKAHFLYNILANQLIALKEYFTEALRKEWIASSAAEYGFSVLFAKKPNGGLRFYMNYRAMNARSKKDVYPLPLISETLDRFGKAKLFTKLDVRNIFHRIRMDPGFKEITTFRTCFGQYKYQVLSFGLTGGLSIFQQYINSVLFPYLDEFCIAYVNDILIFSENPAKHHEHVIQVLEKLKSAELQANIKKSEFSVTKTKFLEYIISTKGIAVDPDKISAIMKWKRLTRVKELQSFLGFCNFYRLFIEDFSRVAKPLHRLTAAIKWEWTQEQQRAFDHLKQALTSAPVLVHFDETRATKLETNASDGMVSGALSQLTDQKE
jgi:hypothetical protein